VITPYILGRREFGVSPLPMKALCILGQVERRHWRQLLPSATRPALTLDCSLSAPALFVTARHGLPAEPYSPSPAPERRGRSPSPTWRAERPAASGGLERGMRRIAKKEGRGDLPGPARVQVGCSALTLSYTTADLIYVPTVYGYCTWSTTVRSV
jgi:hypothetical protein